MAAQTVGYMNVEAALVGFVDAFIEACRTELPAHRLPGQSTFSGPHVHASLDLRAQRIRLCTEELADAEFRADKAERRDLASRDEETSERYRVLGKEARDHARKMRAELAELEAQPTTAPIEGPFDAFTSVILPALATLRTCGGRVSQEQYNALDILLRSFRMFERGGRWWCSASVRVNTTEGIAELGPVEWSAMRTENGTARLAMRVDAVPESADLDRRTMRAAFSEAGGITPEAVSVLLNAPFRALPFVVLHRLRGEPIPDWVGEEWRQEPFVSWVTKVYSDPAFSWRGNGNYATVDRYRQWVTWFASQRDTFTVRDLGEVVPVARPQQISKYTRADSNEKRGIVVRPHEPSIRRVSALSPRQRAVFAGFVCECGITATVVVRVPEVPRDLLCECGRMLDAAEFKMSADVRFPSDYKLLRTPWDECVEYMREELRQRKANPVRPVRLLLGLTELLEVGATDAELTAAVGRTSTMHAPLMDMEACGWLAQGEGAWPVRWRFTDAGREAARQFAIPTD